jgi:hypothetical protein
MTIVHNSLPNKSWLCHVGASSQVENSRF